MILDKVGFDSRISTFFSNCLINRKTQYIWNNFVSSSLRADIGVGQDSALSPILSTLYIALIFYTFEKRTQNILLNIPISTLLFVDNSFFGQFGLMIKHGKSEVFHFSRSIKNFNPLLLDLSLLRGSILQAKDNLRYLEFIFDRKLSF